METDQAFLEYAVKALVDHPESVETTRTIDQMGVLLTLTVHPEDMGKIIGKSGKTAEALRILEQRKITALAVVDAARRVLGVVHLHDLWRTELV